MADDADKELGEYVVDLLAPMGGVELRRFFGGWGLVFDSYQFGVVLLGTLYFCVDDGTRQRYIDEGSEPFEYDTKKRRVTVQRFYEVPARLLEGLDDIVEWAEDALEVSRKKKKWSRR